MLVSHVRIPQWASSAPFLQSFTKLHTKDFEIQVPSPHAKPEPHFDGTVDADGGAVGRVADIDQKQCMCQQAAAKTFEINIFISISFQHSIKLT